MAYGDHQGEGVILIVVLAVVGFAGWGIEHFFYNTNNAKATVAAPAATSAAVPDRPKHYELRTIGFRTFRFDPETGKTCIALTTTADAKNPDTIRQGCPYQDYLDKGYSLAQTECQFLQLYCESVQ